MSRSDELRKLMDMLGIAYGPDRVRKEQEADFGTTYNFTGSNYRQGSNVFLEMLKAQQRMREPQEVKGEFVQERRAVFTAAGIDGWNAYLDKVGK